MNEIYNRGEKPHSIFDQYSGTNKFNRYFYIRIGRIVTVDYDKYKIKVEWITGSGSPNWIPISFPYVGPAGCMGAFPEIGSLVICGYLDDGTGKGVPYALSYLPVALQAGLEHNMVKNLPDSIPTEDDNLFFMKFRKMEKGDLIVASLFGGEIFVNRDVEIKDGQRDNILIRGSDQAIIATSMHNFIFANGAAVSAGPILRNKLNIFDSQGVRIPDQLARENTFPDGRQNIYLVPYGAAIAENTQFYSEYRIEADELVNGILDTNDINSQTALSNRNPIVAFSLGNYAGGNDAHGSYGKIVRPVLFSSSSDIEGQFNLIQCVQNKGMDEVANLGMAYAVHLLKTNSLMALDKEGHYYLNLSSSSSTNPLGAGRSMSIRATGNLKEIWGQANDTGNSWDLATKGGVKWAIGKNNTNGNNSSIDIRAASGVFLQVNGSITAASVDPDLNTDSFAKQEYILGNELDVIGGHHKTSVGASSVLTVDGLKKETIGGAASYSFQSDKSENIMGVYTQVVIKEMQGRFGKRKETVLNGQELTVMTGDMVETIATFGSKKTFLTSGSIVETLLNGYKKINIAVGGYKLIVAAGGIDIMALAGKVNITGTSGVTIKGVKADVSALSVNLGAIPVRGGVVVGLPGVPSHFDYTTGLPLKGSATVKASI